jgi:hypothetical protein
MASIQPFDVGDITAEGVKLWTPSMVCKWVVSTAIDEDIGKHFVEHRQAVGWAWQLMHEHDGMLTEPLLWQHQRRASPASRL